MKKIALLAAMVGLLSHLYAQDTSKMADIKRLLEVSGSSQLGMQMIDNLFDYYKKNIPDVDPAFWDSFKKEIKPDDFINLIIPIYDKHYSHDEILQLISFYHSPIGQKMVQSSPAILEESMKAGQQWGEQIGRRVAKKLKEEGKLK